LTSVLLTSKRQLLTTNDAGFVTSITLYDTLWGYTSIAGIGKFNVTIGTAEAAIFPDLIPINVVAQFVDLFSDPTRRFPLTPTLCTNSDCESYLFPGSWQLIIPNPWLITNYSDADVMITRAAQGLEIDYGPLDASESFEPSNCLAWGSDSAAVQICIASSTVKQNQLNAGSSLFPNFINQY
jgi:hypothetical protein